MSKTRKRDDVEIEDELMEAAAREDEKKAKQRTRKAARQVEEDEDEIDELVQEMRDQELKRFGRGPGVPNSRERKNRDLVAAARGQRKINWAVPDVDYSDTKNPRNSNKDGAVSSRRRIKRWKARERMGMKQRRAVLDRGGKDTGATTSSLG